MFNLQKMILGFTGLLTLLVGVIFLFFYLYQERVIFEPHKLPMSYQFEYPMNFEERLINLTDGTKLNALLFRPDSTKGVVFYLHGNAGSLDQWGYVAPPFLKEGFDVFIVDYRGFGKSEDRISSESQLYLDMQEVYDYLKREYHESEIILVGFSLGTGLAAQLAMENSPVLLILKAPYYSLVNVKNVHFPYIPSFLMRYRMPTHKYIKNINCPLFIFHGDSDEIVPFTSSQKLKELSLMKTELILLKGQNHNGISNNPVYMKKIKEILREIR